MAPLFSIITPIYNTKREYLDEAVGSVIRQGFSDWELILIDDLSTDSTIREHLLELQRQDERIKVVLRDSNGGIAVASNSGVEIAKGEFIALLDHDDLLAPGALGRMAAAIARFDDVDYLYSDEDKMSDNGDFYDTFKKPDWSPERLRAQMYTSHLSVLRTSLVREVGGFDSSFNGSQDHDLVLKVTERSRRIHHVREVLYHWRVHPDSTASSADAKPYAWDAQVRAVSGHLARIGSSSTAVRGPWAGTTKINRAMDPTVKVSVIIPTRGTAGEVRGEPRVYVVEAVRSLLRKTKHPNLEIVIVYDLTTPDDVLSQLRDISGDKLTLVKFAKPFNYSEKCNVGFIASSGEVVVLLNDDVEAISDNLIEELCAPLSEPDVGMTGAYLVFEDGKIQHAGHSYTERGFKHPFQHFSLGDTGPFCVLMVDREVSGLTAACIALRRDTYAEVGGLTETLPLNFNDVDLSIKVRKAGYRLLWLNRVKLYHYESKSRIPQVHQWEIDAIRARWGVPRHDAYLRFREYTIQRRERSGLGR